MYWNRKQVVISVLILLLLATDIVEAEQCVPLPFGVLDRFPEPGAKGVPVTTNISITFTRLAPAIIDYKIEPDITTDITRITLNNPEPYSLPRGVMYDFHPSHPLQTGTIYNVTITYGQSEPPIGSVNSCLNSTTSWHFTTAGLPATNQSPVVVTSTGNVTRNISAPSMISQSVIQPESSLNITLTPSPASLFTSYQVNETIPYGFTFVRASAAYTSQGNEYTFTQNDSAPITYTLIAPTNNSEYTMFGTFKDTLANTGIVSGSPRIWIGVSIASQYAGLDGRIGKSAAAQAVMDYFNGSITRQEAIDVVTAYFSGSVVTM